MINNKYALVIIVFGFKSKSFAHWKNICKNGDF